MKKPWITTAILMELLAAAMVRAEIVYINGPAFPISFDWTQPNSVDLDQDGTADFEFQAGPSLTTGEPGNSSTPFYVVSRQANQLLWRGFATSILPGGSTIGPTAVGLTAWGNPTNGASLAAFFTTGAQVYFTPNGMVTNPPSSGWSGTLVSAKDGYIGVRFAAADGFHYGWIHAAFQSGPLIQDWAYETQSEVSIPAGAAPLAVLSPPSSVRPGTFRLAWSGETGAAYQIQSKSDLVEPAWTNVGLAIIATADHAAVDVPLAGAAGFYRVVKTR